MERAEHQFFLAVEVKASPVQVVELIEQKGGELRAVGDEITLIGKQRFQLHTQHGVAVQAGAGLL